jgi:hypothetical protein
LLNQKETGDMQNIRLENASDAAALATTINWLIMLYKGILGVVLPICVISIAGSAGECAKFLVKIHNLIKSKTEAK